jgi:hypothetical protein
MELGRSATSATLVSSSGISSMATLPAQNIHRSRASRIRGRVPKPHGQPTRTNGPSYWSEYNDTGDKPDDGYYIYVDPNDSVFWRLFFDKIMSLFKIRKKDPRQSDLGSTTLPGQHGRPPKLSSFEPTEQDNLISSRPSSSSSSSDETDSLLSREESHTRYGTFAYERQFDPDNDTISPLIASSIALFLAVVLSLVLLVLRSVGRHRSREEIDGVVTLGILIGLIFGGVGAWGLVGRQSSAVRRSMVVLTYGIIVLMDILLVTKVLNDVRKGV